MTLDTYTEPYIAWADPERVGSHLGKLQVVRLYVSFEILVLHTKKGFQDPPPPPPPPTHTHTDRIFLDPRMQFDGRMHLDTKGLNGIGCHVAIIGWLLY